MKHKFGIIGTSSSGKTTLTHGLVSRLKSYGILADGVFSQDRKFSFPLEKLESEEAQNWMVTNLISKEIDLSLHIDVDVMISDRTPVDLFAYYAVQYDTELSRACWQYVKQWARTYTSLYYLEPLAYHYDGKRPSDSFRLNVNTKLLALIEELESEKQVSIRKLGRHEILNDILVKVGFQKPRVKIALLESDIQQLADSFNKPILLKTTSSKDSLSDYDLWVIDESLDVLDFTEKLEAYKNYAKGLFGPFVPLDIHLVKSLDTFDFKYTLFNPST